MRRFILTGTSGAGKTTLLRYLRGAGYGAVEEAATDVIASEQSKGVAEPWTSPSFIELILDLQERRQTEAASFSAETTFFDRSPLDAYVLCKYLGFPISSALLDRFRAAQEAGRYEKTAFFVENLGFIEATDARKISYEEALLFEKLHEEAYREWGYRLVRVPAAPAEERVKLICAYLESSPR